MLSAAVDAASGVGAFTAVAAGLVSFLSPCVLPLVPGYLSAVTGISVADLEDVGWKRVLAPSLLFVASFSAIFILLGLTATGIGSKLRDHLDALTTISGYLIIAMGVLFIASSFVVSLNREWRVEGLIAPCRIGRPDHRRRRLRDRLDALHRPDPGVDPQRRRDRRLGPARSVPAGLSTRPASRSRSCSRPWPSRG